MCGICGMTGDTDEELLAGMMSAIRHRGPDDSSSHVGPGILLGHQRLSIIDIEGGRQPMSNEDGTVWLVCNGEIYNFKELRATLRKAGHRFKSGSDSEVIVHAYEEYGEQCLSKLVGMFAFALWDAPKRTLMLARDRLGIKPLYYAQTGDRLLFASEIKAILEDPQIGRHIDHSALQKYLAFRYVPAPETLFAGVYKLEPGSYIKVAEGSVLARRYWSLSFAAASRADEGVFAELFAEAVSSELVSDRPVGVYLSGGVDSSYLAAVAGKALGRELRTFSVSFAGESEDEGPHAAAAAAELGTDHTCLDVGRPEMDHLRKVAWHLDEPLGDAAALPVFSMAMATKAAATVVLSGEGADELLGGYPQLRAVDQARRWPRWAPGRPVAWVAARREAKYAERFWNQRQAATQGRAFLEAVRVFTAGEKRALMVSGETAGTEAEEHLAGFVDSQFPGSGGFMENVLGFYLRYWLADDLLLKNDKMTMAHGVEARVPYLDHRLVEYAAGLPRRARARHGRDKYILRKAAAGVLPPAMAARPKHGFVAPVASWMTGQLAHDCRELLLEGPSVRDGLFSRQAVEQVLSADLNATLDRRAMWTLLAFELWREAYDVLL